MSYTVIGTCGKCGGAVATPTAWWGVTPPVPACLTCGAYAKQNRGPTIEMEEGEGFNPGKELLLEHLPIGNDLYRALKSS